MIGEYQFSALTEQGKKLNFTVDIDSQNIKKDEHLDFIIKLIISDSFKFSKNLPNSHLHIKIISHNKFNDTFRYTIIEERGLEHEVALEKIKDLDHAMEDIASKHILPVDKTTEEIGQLSLLERFAVIEEKSSGFFSNVKQVLADFFSIILFPFKQLQKLYHAITGQAEKQLKWDINLLAEICGTHPTAPMSMMHSLEYMSTMLDREREETADPVMRLRFKNGFKLAQDIDGVRKKFSESKAQKVANHTQKSITNLKDNEKVIIPIGYMENGKLIEALLEVSKDSNNKYRAVFISAQSETRDLFDREMGLEIGSQSMRREITGIDPKDLLAAIPTLIELQTSPSCLQGKDSAWRGIFLQTLKFEKSTVEISKTTELHRGIDAPGHLGEMISYVKREITDEDDSKRFDLAIRLQLFLDVCKTNKKGLKDKQFWTSVRTTAKYLATQIDQEKSVLGTQKKQGIELTRIYGELKQLLDELDSSPPELVNLEKISLPLVSGRIEAVTHPETPKLGAIQIEPNVYPKVDPPFAVLDSTKPWESIKNWGLRCREMIKNGKFEEASREAKLMVQMLPKKTDVYQGISSEQANSTLAAFNDIGEAIARGAMGKDQSTLQDIGAIVTLNFHAYQVNANIADWKGLAHFITSAKQILNDLLSCHLPVADRIRFQALKDRYINDIPEEGILKKVYDIAKDKNFPLLNISRFTEMTLHGARFASLAASRLPIQFKLEPPQNRYSHWSVTIPEDPSYESTLDATKYKIPLALRAPSYAHDVSQEITNRYLSNFCCLGCIRDNCPNYNEVDKKDHRFHPLFMLHNYSDIFCEKLTNKNQLRRNEITDLMYTQQTNQDANEVWENVHNMQHGFDIASGFNEDDYNIQFMNTFMVYLDHPHFFKQPELRWQFETKVFKQGTFAKLLGEQNINIYKPFLTTMLNRLKKEISISKTTGDQETAAYLMYVCEELKDTINASQLSNETKQSLIGLMHKDITTTLFNWARDLVGKNDEFLLKNQLMVLPLLLQNYYKKFVENCNDPCFDSDKDLELILSAIARIEMNDKLVANIDPETRDRYQTLLSLVLNKTRVKVNKETKVDKGTFVNKILMHIHPHIAQMRLNWDPADFPTFLALTDKKKLYQFDLTSGKLSFKNLESSSIPNNIKRHPAFTKLFGATLNENWTIQGTPPSTSERIVAYTHEKYPNFRIVTKRGASDSVSSAPEIIIERNIAKSGSKKEIWVTYTEFDTQDRLLNHKPLRNNPDIPVSVALFIGDRSCWIDRAKNKIYVFELDGVNPYAIINLKVQINKKTLEETVTVKDVHLIKEDTHLLEAGDKELEQYSSIEDPRFIQVLGKKQRAAEVSYHRYAIASTGAPLTYDIGKNEITCKAFPKYKLAPSGVRPGSADPALGVTPLPSTFDGFQLLQKDGDQKVLIPLRRFEQQYAVSGDPLPFSKTVFPEGFDKCTLYEFSVDQVTNRLVAKSGDAYAYLAYLSMAHWDYESAAYYLSKARTTAGYDVNYDQVFKWAIEWKDESPNGIAMKLHFELFREKVLEDRRVHQIREGNLKIAQEISIQKDPRLIQIADLYEKYHAMQIGSESGVDPSLALTFEEIAEVKRLINSLLASHGKENVDTHEPKPIRAEEIPLQQFVEHDTRNLLNLNEGMVILWTLNGTDKNRTPFVLNDPRWIIQNFRDLFNQILEADIGSLKYKQLKLQIRLISQLTKKDLNSIEESGVKSAQSYLLKLMTLKETNAQGFTALKENLGEEGKLTFAGPFFNSSRVYATARINAATGDKGFDNFALTVPKRAQKKANEIINRIKMDKMVQETTINLNVDPYNLNDLAEEVLEFTNKWIENPPVGQDFSARFKLFLMSECFGTKGAKNILLMDKVFKSLEEIQIVQPVQIMKQPPEVAAKPSITFNDKYRKLVDEVPENLEARIEKLEKDIAARAEPPAPKMVVTQADKIHTVIGDVFVEEYSKFFKKTETAAPTINNAIFDDLSHSSEKAFARIAKKNRTDLNAYLSTKTTVSISKLNAQVLKKELIAERERITQAEETLRRDLLQYVELFDTPAGILAMRRLVGKGVKPSLDLLISLWRRGETAKAWKDHPLKKLGMKEIPESDLKKLDSDISKYLEISTVHHHLNRVIDMADNYLNTCGKENDSSGDVQLANELFEGLQAKRNYSLDRTKQGNKENPDLDYCDSDYRDLQYVEYTLKIIMYADQIQTLREMSYDPNAVRQLRMGRGKTEVIMPILAKKKATGKNLAVLLLPEELYEANCRGLDIKNRLLFGQEMHRFDFSLKTDKSVKALQTIRLRLLQTMHDYGFINSTKRSLLSLKNTYILLLNKLSKYKPDESPPQELLGQVREMSKIVALFSDQADILADEVDACLDVRKEVNIALGDAQPVDQIKGDVGADLMQMILSQEKPGDPLYELRDALIHNTQAAISPDQRKKLLTDLVGIYYETHKNLFPGLDKEAFVKYIMNESTVSECQTWMVEQKKQHPQLFKDIESHIASKYNQPGIPETLRKKSLTTLVTIYYNNHQEQLTAFDKETFVKNIVDDALGGQKWVFEQKGKNNDLFKQITSLKAYIDQGFGTTFGRIGNVNYGRDPVSGVNTIPYAASNTPIINSEFDDDIERISFIYQDYLQNGVSYPQVYQIIAEMQKRALTELRSAESNEFSNVLNTEAAKEFEDFIKKVDPEGKVGASITLSGINDPKMVKVLVAAINSSPKSRLAFCQSQVIRKMKQYSAQVNSMSTEAPELVRNFGGFTGTPWNIHTYHDKINAKPNLGVDGMTWALMLGRKVDIQTFPFDAEKPIDSLLSHIDIVGNCQAVIDTGAYLRGTSNEEFNDRVLELARERKLPVNAGIYFDESGKIVKKQEGEKSLAIETAPVTDLMTNLTLYDQAHTVGADIKQGKKAKAIVTIGENTFIRDLFQAVWRLRQLHQEQTVILAVSDKIKQRILGNENRPLTIEDIHKFCLMNEARREAEDNFRAEKEKIQGYSKRALLPEIVKVVNPKASDKTIIQMAQKFAKDDAELFIKLRPKEEAYDEYGKVKTQESPAETFSRLKVKEKEKSKKIAQDFKEINEKASQRFNKIGGEIDSRRNPPVDWFPNKVDTRESGGGEVEQEAQAEVEQEVDLLIQTTTQSQTDVIKEVFIPIAPTGAADHGDVTTLTMATIIAVVQTGKSPQILWPCGARVGDRVEETSSYNNLQQLRQISSSLPYFDPTIFCTGIFERNLPAQIRTKNVSVQEAKKLGFKPRVNISPIHFDEVSPKAVFYSNRKPVKAVLITKCNNQWTMLIPTVHEAHGTCREFTNNNDQGVQTIEVGVSSAPPLVLYKNGNDRSDSLPFIEQKDKDQFYRLYIQAKLFNGEIEYGSKEEQDALKIWLQEKMKTGDFRKYFEENILAAKPKHMIDAYPKSSLFKIFNELAPKP